MTENRKKECITYDTIYIRLENAIESLSKKKDEWLSKRVGKVWGNVGDRGYEGNQETWGGCDFARMHIFQNLPNCILHIYICMRFITLQ